MRNLDRELPERLRAGDDAAWEELVRSEGGRLLGLARRILGNEDAARDALQDAFASAFRSIGGFDGGSRLSTWLHRIVVNASLMKLRGRRRKAETSIEELLPRFDERGRWTEPPGPATDLDETLDRAEVRRAVRRAIDRLPELYRVVLVLRDLEQLDTAETAAILGISDNAVKVRLHRARLALRTRIGPLLGDFGLDDRASAATRHASATPVRATAA